MARPASAMHAFRYRDYASWPEDFRCELIRGEIHAMSPAPSVPHQEIAGAFYRALYGHMAIQGCRVLVAPVDVLLPRPGQADEDADTVVQPDVLVVCDGARITDRYVRGAPDLVVEVLSPATAKKDEGLKRDLYAQSGVAEYWLVHPTDHTVNRYRLVEGGYGLPDVFGQGDILPSTRFPELAITLDEIFGPAPLAPPLPGAGA